MSGQRKDRTFLTPLISWDMVNELRQAQYSWDEIAEMVKTKTFECSTVKTGAPINIRMIGAADENGDF